MLASVQGVASLAADLIVLPVQQVHTNQSVPVANEGGSEPTTLLADAPRVDPHHLDVTACANQA
jgi:hypothetical protein